MLGDERSKEELDLWKRDVRSRLPAASTFKGRPVHFAYTDAKKIRKKLLADCPYHEDRGDGKEFTVAVRVFAYHGGICSVWVYFGVIDTELTSSTS